MSIARIVWLLQNRSLYFARSDLLGDPFEGYYTEPTIRLAKEYVDRQMRDPEFAARKGAADLARENFHTLLGTAEREDYFVNCWHMNDEESLAMWKLYAAHNESICIQSTYNTLHNLLPAKTFLGTVNYIDYAKESPGLDNGFYKIVHKRKSFAHEHELRAVIWRHNYFDVLPNGSLTNIVVPIDTKNLMKAVYVSPDAEPILAEVVSGLCAAYGIDAPVHKSEALAPPKYLIEPGALP